MQKCARQHPALLPPQCPPWMAGYCRNPFPSDTSGRYRGRGAPLDRMPPNNALTMKSHGAVCGLTMRRHPTRAAWATGRRRSPAPALCGRQVAGGCRSKQWPECVADHSGALPWFPLPLLPPPAMPTTDLRHSQATSPPGMDNKSRLITSPRRQKIRATGHCRHSRTTRQ